MNKNKKRLPQNLSEGFTLIELLVVIAIIGILATIVLVSMTPAREKANDVAVKTAFKDMKSVAELIYNDNINSYVNLCDPATNLLKTTGTNGHDDQTFALHSGIVANNRNVNEICYSAIDTYCVKATLATSGTSWCADSTGFMGTPGATGCSDSVTHNLCNN